MNKRVVILAILLIAALPLLAQDDFPRGQVFGGYSYLSADTKDLSGRQSLNGWNAHRLAHVDWLRTQHFSTGQNNIRFSTGIMFNFGK
jgi:hypothetical protein